MSKDIHKYLGDNDYHDENDLYKIVIRQEFDRVRGEPLGTGRLPRLS